MSSPQNDANDQYVRGLTTGESVVSSHFMHTQNLSDRKMYTAEKFATEALSITPEEARDILIPMLKNAAVAVIEKRSLAAKEKAEKAFSDYGYAGKKSVGTPEYITEAIVDHWFRKSSVSPLQKLSIRDHVRGCIHRGEPIKLVVPMMPNKVACPLKCRGELPCMAEAGLLARLGEIAGMINKLYQEGHPASAGKQMAQFTVVSDGNHIASSWKTKKDVVGRYQSALKWWTKQLGIENAVIINDYQHLLESSLTGEQKAVRQKHYGEAIALMEEKLGKTLDPMNVELSLRKAIVADPYTDPANPEGRFVPLFKSTIYNIRYTLLDAVGDMESLNAKEFGALYRELTKNLFKPYADITEADQDRIHGYLMNQNAKDKPSVPEIMEHLRRSMLAEAWHSTMVYMAGVVADRTLMDDPVAIAVPNAIRFTTHAKPGQIALAVDSTNSDLVQPWQGTGLLRVSKSKIKLAQNSALALEGSGAKPIVIRSTKAGARSADSDDVLEQFAQSGQPFVYICPEMDFYQRDKWPQSFTHTK